MNKNPNILIVSLVTGDVVTRTTFAEFAAMNVDAFTPADIQAMADELTAKRSCTWDGPIAIIDVTPTEADVVAWMRARVAELGERFGTSDSAMGLTVFPGKHKSFAAHSHGFCELADNATAAIEGLARLCGTLESIIEGKRKQAHALLAEIEALTATQPQAAVA